MNGPRASLLAGAGFVVAAGVALGAASVVDPGALVPRERDGSGIRETPARTAGPPQQRRASAGDIPYDGRFTFARIRFETSLGGGFIRSRDAPWAHDYPRAERNFMRILEETTSLDPHLDGSNVLATDDPELFRYPVAYLVEPGFWNPSEAEVRGLRAWLRKGGFLIVDDFRGRDWRNFAGQMRRVLPDEDLVELDVSHPVFQSFFRIEALDLAPPTFRQYEPAYYGIFEDNDPEGRLMLVANYNNDIGDYWEWSDVGYVPIDLSNEAYKLGVNYIIYGMTH